LASIDIEEICSKTGAQYVIARKPFASCHSERSEETHAAQDRLREESRPFASPFSALRASAEVTK